MIFFTLLDESLKLDGNEYLAFAQISILPHLKKNDAQKVMKVFEQMSQAQDIQSDIASDRARLRKLFKGR